MGISQDLMVVNHTFGITMAIVEDGEAICKLQYFELHHAIHIKLKCGCGNIFVVNPCGNMDRVSE